MRKLFNRIVSAFLRKGTKITYPPFENPLYCVMIATTPAVMRIETNPTCMSIETLRKKVETLVNDMYNHWSTYNDPHEIFSKEVFHLQINSSILTINVSNVFREASGWRAFLTGIVRVITKGRIHLSYDPDRMTVFIARVKVLMLELVDILSKNQANSDFITSVFNNPDNCGHNTFETYTTMVFAKDYQMTSFEMRLLCVLFGLFNESLSQVNIIRKTPQFGEIYQSLSASGRIEPVSNEHINILHIPRQYFVPGEYNAIVKLSVLPAYHADNASQC
jgi:hypothetical protein